MSAVALERSDLSDPSTWKMAPTDETSLETRILAGLRSKGYPATSVSLDSKKLKGGYICDTMRVLIDYSTAPNKTELASDTNVNVLPKSVLARPSSAILKIASPLSNDHDVALRLRLYEREWHFYEHIAARVPVRVPAHLGSVKDEATGLITEGVLLEDLEIPGAELCPKMDDAGVLQTVAHIARQHAQFWNDPQLSSGALGIKPHNSPWYQPGWGNDLADYWPRFETKWRARAGGDAMGPGLPEEAFAIGKRIVECFGWVQDELSSKPHTFNHGDVKPPNMFMMPGGVPAFIDWQYTAVGKGCQDVVFFLIEGYDVNECRRLEPIVMKAYHASLVHNGVSDYSMDDLTHDWKLACMHFPLYVALWFGTTPDEQLVDPGFPRRFVPRAFDAILRNRAHELLPVGHHLAIGMPPEPPSSHVEDVFSAAPAKLEDCQTALYEARAALAEMRRQRDTYKNALDAITAVAAAATAKSGVRSPSSP
uniref:Aminoglycoside phosphotransferase domain-containing protein n=1 Tax=Haptolina brevifila TaxID=156173 RepID=A0A7S2JQQ5_9EUKA|mmetsp:Transcript_8728/g.17735  ORF Transcript_8728/g.17735 Transcript_8728/m.17735 type:complete len:481 (+) Transcript_8728:40-1482(+)|eukprot:CAMPEP_0174717250 /NCGR_PEP_ID=MMETSP1094-20130205/26330_1 /TAXON_ID=156173 /ORGANISM="Chrysochromulina brevifilum, Strain UTEX LB 985" /LENGTH=480 /DNA_ID=CAMNT_0015917163 /DNA_START=33 /DNA_END=1475 /DNA_ORIENTATION=-